MNLPNITHKDNIAATVSADDSYYSQIAYFKTIEDFVDESAYSKFLKAVEAMVRQSDDYKVFVMYIKKTLGLDFCQVMSKVHDKVDANVEFHHGPWFTLYDICETELMKFIKTGQRINTFRLADSVLDLHFQFKVNGVMLATTAHESVHNGDTFINMNQTIGDVNSYIREYANYFTDEMKYKLWTYVEFCKSNPSFDKGVLDMEIVKTYIQA